MEESRSGLATCGPRARSGLWSNLIWPAAIWLQQLSLLLCHLRENKQWLGPSTHPPASYLRWVILWHNLKRLPIASLDLFMFTFMMLKGVFKPAQISKKEANLQCILWSHPKGQPIQQAKNRQTYHKRKHRCWKLKHRYCIMLLVKNSKKEPHNS